jgi:hypothetical protein
VAGHRQDNAAIAALVERLCLRRRLVHQYHHGNRAAVRLHSEVRHVMAAERTAPGVSSPSPTEGRAVGATRRARHASNGANFTIAATDAELFGSFSGDQFIGQDLGATNFGGPGQ